MVKQNKLFTFIYVTGTALAIATTMIMAIVYYVKIAPIYPEVNRDHTLYISVSRFVSKQGQGSNQWAFSYLAVKEWFYTLKNVEAVSAERTSWEESNYIQPFDQSGDFAVIKKAIDPAFFRIYQFRFVEGKPFSEADWKSGLKSAVISDVLARRIFGTDHEIVGKTFIMNYLEYRVAGVVESASILTKRSFAQVYVPYSSEFNYDKTGNLMPYYGAYEVTILIASAEQKDALRKEIDELVRKYNSSQDRWELKLRNQPRSHIVSVFQHYVGDDFSWGDVVRHYLLVLVVLLLVPALNLSGMIAGRMEMRLSEMGIRKSFGADRIGLLIQVMWENLLLTIAGGVMGLILAWTALIAFRDWLFALFDEYPNVPLEGVTTKVSGEMLLAPSVFAAALFLCVVLNLLSALVPAWHSLRNPIIQSLNEKR